MCPACYSALIWMIAGVATSTVSGTTAVVVANQIRREKKLERLNLERLNLEKENDN